ncbi:MAG: hypothetical protein ACOCVL_00545 [Candidatus Sumerlaeota bacterium]
MNKKHILLLCLMVLSPGIAQAYIGPGIGAGTVGIILGFIASILLALFAIFWYPIKRLVRKIRGTQPAEEPAGEPEHETEEV